MLVTAILPWILAVIRTLGRHAVTLTQSFLAWARTQTPLQLLIVVPSVFVGFCVVVGLLVSLITAPFN